MPSINQKVFELRIFIEKKRYGTEKVGAIMWRTIHRKRDAAVYSFSFTIALWSS